MNDATVDRVFPGLGWRPLWLTVVATWCLSLYDVHGSPSLASDAWMRFCADAFGPNPPLLYRHWWAHAMAVLLLLAVPMIACGIGGIQPRELGLRLKGTGREWLLVLGMWLAFVPVVWWFSSTPSFAATYPRLPAAENDAGLYVLYELTYLVKWTAWEFFFRGFMLFGFAKEFGPRAALISTIPFALMHYGKPEIELLAALPSGILLCWIAWRSKSIWPGVFLHFAVAATMDFFASTWWH